jgi:Leucine-rich repeat (LRR) protein
MVTTTILSSLAQTQSWDIGQLNLIKTDDLWHFETRDGQTVAELGIWSEVAGFHNYYMGTYSVSKLSDSYSDTLKLTNNMCHYFIVSNQEHEEFLLGGYQTIEPLKLARGIENIDEETQALFLYGDSIHKKIPEQTLPKLRFLSASNATLKAYSDQLPQIQQLRHLYISRGKGEEIPKEIGQLTNLMELRLSYMKINSLPPSIKNLTQLKVLSLFYNRFEELPKELEALQNLEVLVLT